MAIVKKTAFGLKIDPTVTVDNVTGKKGKDAPEDGQPRTNDSGNLGAIKLIGPGGAGWAGSVMAMPHGHANLWADSLAVDAVIACAQDAYRNGFRTQAWELLTPYCSEFSDVSNLTPALSARLATISAIRANLLANVDCNGHPPGWVPRLRAETNFAIYSEVRKSATDLFLFARTRLAASEAREVARVNTREISTKLWSEIDYRRKVVVQAARELARAREDVAGLATKSAAIAVQIENLRTWVADEAKDKVQAQRIFKGVMKLVAGAMKVFPYGQPCLGLGGDIVAGAGDFDWNKKNAGAQWEPILKGLGTKVGTFLEDNKDLIVSDIAGRAPDNRVSDRALADRLQAAKDELQVKEKNQAQAADVFKTTWTTEKGIYLAEQQKRLEKWKTEYESIANVEERQKKEAAYKHLIEELGFDEAKDFLATGLALKKKIATLEEEIRKADATERARLQVEKKALTGLKDKIDTLEGDKKKNDTKAARDKEDREKTAGAVTEGLKRLKGIGDGIGQIGAGIATLATPVTRDDPEVKEIVADLLDVKRDVEAPNQKRDEYRKLLKDIAEVQATQQATIRMMMGAQRVITANTAAIPGTDRGHRSRPPQPAAERRGRHAREPASP